MIKGHIDRASSHALKLFQERLYGPLSQAALESCRPWMPEVRLESSLQTSHFESPKKEHKNAHSQRHCPDGLLPGPAGQWKKDSIRQR